MKTRRIFVYSLGALVLALASHCQPQKPPSLKIRGVFGLVEIITSNGHIRPVEKGDRLYQGQSLVTGKNSRAELKLPKGYLRLYSGSQFQLGERTDRRENTWADYHFARGTFKGRFKVKKTELVYLSSRAFTMSSRAAWFSLKVGANADVDLKMFSGAGLVNKNYPGLNEKNAKLVESSNILTNIDKFVKIGDVVSKYRHLRISGNKVRVYNEMIHQMLAAAEIAHTYYGHDITTARVDTAILKRLNVDKDHNFSDIYDLRISSIKDKKYRKKMRKEIKALKKRFNLTEVYKDVTAKKKGKS